MIDQTTLTPAETHRQLQLLGNLDGRLAVLEDIAANVLDALTCNQPLLLITDDFIASLRATHETTSVAGHPYNEGLGDVEEVYAYLESVKGETLTLERVLQMYRFVLDNIIGALQNPLIDGPDTALAA